MQKVITLLGNSWYTGTYRVAFSSKLFKPANNRSDLWSFRLIKRKLK